MTTYEYPLSERVRTLLRLEDLFEKQTHFADSDAGQDHHVALTTLFEVLEAQGIGVLRLIRVAIGPLQLGALAKGQWRWLDEHECR